MGIFLVRMDFEAEYQDFFPNLGREATCAYKFFDLFKINLGTGKDEKGNVMEKGLHWGKSCHDDELSDEELRALKTYIKDAKSWLRKEQKAASINQMRKRMWFLVQKLIEFGAFTRGDRNQIIQWMAGFNFVNGYPMAEGEEDEAT